MSNINLAKNMTSLNVGRKLPSFTGVIVHAGKDDGGDDLDFSVGSSSGYVLELTNPICTKKMASGVLASLKLRGYRYQPFEAESALLDPAAEIGDNVTVNGTPAIIFNRTLDFAPLMPANISAPYDEEVNHAFKYEPAIEREFKRESKYTRSRIKQNKDSIQLEVVRATDAENELGARIDVRLNSISLSVSGTDGTSIFKIMDGSTTLNTTRFDISVKAMNVNGQLTASQIAAGAITVGKLDADAKSKVVKSSITKTQYLLHTSSSSLPANPTWLDTMPTWESGKYLWTRQVTTDTYLDDSTNERATTGKYDKNLTTALSTASSASTSAAGAMDESNTLYHSIAPNASQPSAPSSWVTNATGNQNVWTTVRPEYSSSYPSLYYCTQKRTVGGTVTFSAVKLDVTTTVIDGAHILTGSIDATKINVSDLSALNATIGGWTIESTRLSKGGGANDLLRVRIMAPSAPQDTDNAISVATRATTSDSFSNKFTVSYGGKVTCSDIKITGGAVGGATVGTSSFGGIPSSGGSLIVPTENIKDEAITGAKIKDREVSRLKFCLKAIDEDAIDDEAIISRVIKAAAVTSAKVSTFVSDRLTYANNYNNATGQNTALFPEFFTAKYLYAKETCSAAGFNCTGTTSTASFTLGGRAIEKKSANVRFADGTTGYIYYLGSSSSWS